MARRWMGAPAAAVAAALAAGCGPADESDENVGEAWLESEVCGDGPTLPGVDVSYYQDVVDWNAMAADGIVFAVARISHGTSFDDPQFANNWQGMKDAGIVRAAYQYFDPADDIAAEAQKVIDAVGWLAPGDLPPVIDVEQTSGVGPAGIAAAVGTWLDLVEAGTGRKPIIYTGRYFWQDNVGSDAYADYPLWHAQYTTAPCPNIADQWSDWAIWQYTSSGNVGGITPIDRNRFNGDEVALHDLAADGLRAAIVSIDYPGELEAGETGIVEIVLENNGWRTWGAGTKLGTTEPRDRASELTAPSWESDHRALAMPMDVPRGEQITLDFEIVAPAEPGDYIEHFNLVEEGFAWFSDTPPGGEPLDDAIALEIRVTEGSGNGPGVGSGGPTGAGAGGSAAVAGIPDSESSCAVAQRPSRWSAAWLLAGLLFLRRRTPRRGTIRGGRISGGRRGTRE
jgi:lysozyme